ncbi:molybdopterin-dependent oxidoreductase [Microbacterium sp. MYb62]|uniref:molybdopterin-dependent oxidoreductase n=1 Tax=Microbacterium sp. MYb62 TaxID=1848690 RepID=UPI000CFDD408|nr:molybdopterin-dependent oxidoreductase [Microbacterium sp. MYb62]PRB19188.1 molybdopterin-binding protein [Microbacterium sp. MYb62]
MATPRTIGSVTERLSNALQERSERVRAALGSPLRTTRTTVVVGRLLGAAFLICFLTGIYSNLLQSPLPWLSPPPGPAHLYAWTQGTHVVVGAMLIPLLLAKLWVVFPQLFTWPPVRSLPHLLERASLAILVATALMEPITGVLNALKWYPWDFSFRRTHFALAWVLIGAMIVHIAVHLPAIIRAWRSGGPGDDREPVQDQTPEQDRTETRDRHQTSEEAGAPKTTAVSRRRFLGVVGGASALTGVAALAHAVAPIGPFSLKEPRARVSAAQGVTVNRSARQAEVTDLASDPGWMLRLGAGEGALALARADLEALPQRTEVLPIACVEGWTIDATWTGVRLRDLLDLGGMPEEATIRLRSLQRRGAFRETTMPAAYARDPRTLIALRLNGEPLDLDHGYPARVIAPGRPGVLQTKWLTSIEVA